MIVKKLDLDLLDRRADAREVDADKVRAIGMSLVDVGLINPIRVRETTEGRYEIVAGVHRVEAHRGLGLAEIEALVVNSGDLFAELAMIDENLCRSDLGPSDRARQTARRKAIYEEIHPETRPTSEGGEGRHAETRRQNGDETAPRFTADTAAATGNSERTVQRDAERGEKISPDVLELVRGTELDRGTYLDGLKKFAPDQQRMLVERDLDALQRGEVNGARAIAARRQEPADSLDYFPTPPWATRALVELVLPMLGRGPFATATPGPLGRVWEPACGEGHMSGVLAEYFDDVLASDIASYSNNADFPPGWIGRIDFLSDAAVKVSPPAAWIITNPPFADVSLAFALQALRLATEGVALFVRQQWLEGVGRFSALFSKYPPALVAQFAERVNLKKGEWDPEGDTLTSYIWVVWTKGDRLQNGDTLLCWIPPGQRDALTRPDDIERFTAHPVRTPQIPDSASGADRDADGVGVAQPIGAPSAKPSSAEINALIEAAYAAEVVDFAALEAATGLSRVALRKRASRLGLGDNERQREAARRVATAMHASREDAI